MAYVVRPRFALKSSEGAHHKYPHTGLEMAEQAKAYVSFERHRKGNIVSVRLSASPNYRTGGRILKASYTSSPYKNL